MDTPKQYVGTARTAAAGPPPDYRAYFDLETYLFGTVTQRFRDWGYLAARDFFCIVIWKANRAKSKVARTLLKRGKADLETAVYRLTTGLAALPAGEARLRDLIRQVGSAPAHGLGHPDGPLSRGVHGLRRPGLCHPRDAQVGDFRGLAEMTQVRVSGRATRPSARRSRLRRPRPEPARQGPLPLGPRSPSSWMPHRQAFGSKPVPRRRRVSVSGTESDRRALTIRRARAARRWGRVCLSYTFRELESLHTRAGYQGRGGAAGRPGGASGRGLAAAVVARRSGPPTAEIGCPAAATPSSQPRRWASSLLPAGLGCRATPPRGRLGQLLHNAYWEPAPPYRHPTVIASGAGAAVGCVTRIVRELAG